MNDFETLLQRQQLRRIPAEWRSKILYAAHQQQPEEKPSEHPWWLAWLWPSPVAWAGVACTWLLIIGLNLASRTPASEASSMASVSVKEVETALFQQRQLVQELFRSENEPAKPPRKHYVPGACNGRPQENAIA